MVNNLMINPLSMDAVGGSSYYDRAGSIGSILWGGNLDTDSTVTVYNAKNLIINPELEDWSSGTSVAPPGWVLAGTDATVARESTIVRDGSITGQSHGSYSAKLTRVGNDCKLSCNVLTASGHPISWWQGRYILSGCWIYATAADRAYIETYDGVTTTTSAAHPGNSAWAWLGTAIVAVNASATEFTQRLIVKTGNTSAYFVGALMMEERPLLELYSTGPAVTMSYPRPLPFNGIYVMTMTGGTLQIQT